MKKQKFFIIVICCLYLMLFFTSCSKDSETPTEPLLEEPVEIFSEDFESYTIGETPWTDYNSTGIEVTDTTSSGGSKSLAIVNVNGTDSGIYQDSTGYKGDSKVYFSVRVDVEASPSNRSYLYFMGITVMITFKPCLYLQDTDHAVDFNKEIWYSGKLEIDWDTSKCKLYVGDTSTGPISFVKPGTASGWKMDISLTETTNIGGGPYIFLDDIKIFKMNVEL